MTTAWAYVGSRTTRARNAQGCGISVFRRERHLLELVQTVKAENPSFLALSRDRTRLYTVHGDGDEVSVLGADPRTGHVNLLQTLKCGGRNPVHLVLDPQERHVIVSNHASGNIAVMPTLDDGLLAPPVHVLDLPGTPGPHRDEQPHAKPHQAMFDASGQWLLVPDKGLDRIFVIGYDNGQLRLADTASARAREGAGPRHLAWHPHGPWCYVLNEIDATIAAWHFDADTPRLVGLQRVASVNDAFIGDSRAAEIVVHPSGRFLYASTRGADSVSAFAIDRMSGALRLVQTVESGGHTPRCIALSPQGDALFALNENSNTIQAFAVDNSSLELNLRGKPEPCGSPVSMVFSEPDLP